jgi:hypothetical protein
VYRAWVRVFHERSQIWVGIGEESMQGLCPRALIYLTCAQLDWVRRLDDLFTEKTCPKLRKLWGWDCHSSLPVLWVND